MSHKRLSLSREARRKTQLSLVSQERLIPSPRSENSPEGVLGSHERFSSSQEARGKTQISLVSQERLMPSLRPERNLE